MPCGVLLNVEALWLIRKGRSVSGTLLARLLLCDRWRQAIRLDIVPLPSSRYALQPRPNIVDETSSRPGETRHRLSSSLRNR
jgi:hypothetical protein